MKPWSKMPSKLDGLTACIKSFKRKNPNFDSSSFVNIVELTENVCFTGTTPIHKQSVLLLSLLKKGGKTDYLSSKKTKVDKINIGEKISLNMCMTCLKCW